MISLAELCSGLPLDPLPPKRSGRDDNVPHAPVRTSNLTKQEELIALKNALRYFPSHLHNELAEEFVDELQQYGHIYMYRFLPNIPMRAYPINEYPCQTKQAAAIMGMIMNNLDHSVAQFPHELVTYGGNGQVFSNWAQFWIVMYYLSIMSDEQTLAMYSGHPMGLFPSSSNSPRVVITNGMVIPNHSSTEDYDRMFALGVTMYGQMTAGSYCYIGPQGIVHGTTLTVANAGRKYLGTDDLAGKLFVTAGLGGMSGAQAKAGVIAGCVTIVAEFLQTIVLNLKRHQTFESMQSHGGTQISREAVEKRHKQGWLCEIAENLDDLIDRAISSKKGKKAVSIGYHGNIVDVWEHFAKILDETGECLVNLGSDQTSLHNPFNGGYYPVQVSFEESNQMMHENPVEFKKLVEESLRRQVNAINKLSKAGMKFWDYGNAFLLQASKAGADVEKEGAMQGVFKYPTYVQDIMGDIFSLGFGPFRWVCTSCLPSDLEQTDRIAADVLKEYMTSVPECVANQAKDNLYNSCFSVPECVANQVKDNLKWIQEAGKHKLVVGSLARILYCDQVCRMKVAIAFNDAIANDTIKGPIVLSRDHHDVSGTDSPFRETSNIYDGSSFCADMAIQNVIGDSFRGATWVAIHNGGGCGWGEVINGGFGLVLDGSKEAGERAKSMLSWDVMNGVSRRAWCGNDYAQDTVSRAMERDEKLKITRRHDVHDIDLLKNLLLKE